MLEFSIITISSFVTLLVSITRYIGKFCFKKDISRALPIFSIVFGVTLGICGFYTPNVEMGSNLIEAIFIGLSAGAAATGINQVGKQLNKKDKEYETQNSVNTAMSVLGEFLESIKTDTTDMDESESLPEEEKEADMDYSENE